VQVAVQLSIIIFIQDDGVCSSARSSTTRTFTFRQGEYIAIILQSQEALTMVAQVGMETTVEEWLMKKYEGVICRITRERKRSQTSWCFLNMFNNPCRRLSIAA